MSETSEQSHEANERAAFFGGLPTAEDRAEVEQRIRQKAYEIYRSRNDREGDELADWLAAEREVRLDYVRADARQ
jgi:hypothetical protein